MSQFSITTLFVATGGTLASTGTTADLTPGQLGVFRPDYSIATTGNIAAASYIYIAQGRIEVVPGLGSKRSDRIASSAIVEWYKVTSVANTSVQITTFSGFNLLCNQDITLSFVLHSNYINTLYYNGLTQSVVVTSACCNCGTAPCTVLTGTDVQNFVDAAVAKLQANPLLSRYLTFQRQSSGATSTLVVSELALTKYGQPCDVSAFPFEWDRLWFRGFAISGPPTTQDYEVLNSCSQVATVTVNQRSTYDMGSSDSIKQLEKNFYSFQTGNFKALYNEVGWNGAFSTYVTDGTYYDTYYLKFYPKNQGLTFTDYTMETETVIVAFPAGNGATFETLLTAFAGAPVDESSTNPTTTTTTSTTSTSTTSTTTIFP